MTEEKLPYQPWKERDFESAECVKYEMTAVQRWMYRTLLQQAWVCSARPYLPNDSSRLWRLAGCESPDQWTANRDIILRCFDVLDLDGQEVLAHPVIIKDWEFAVGRRTRSQRGGAASVAARARKKSRPEPGTEAAAVPAEDIVGKTLSYQLGFTSDLGDEMRAQKEIRVLCRRLLGLAPDPDQYSSWRDLRELVEAFDNQAVVDAFAAWAAEQDASDFAARSKWPVSEFVRVATGLCSGTIRTDKDPRLEPLLIDLVAASAGDVSFDAEQARQIGRLLERYTPEEILSGFRTFYGQVQDDPFKLKSAGRKFPETAAQLIEYEKRQRAVEEAARQEIERQSRTLRVQAAESLDCERTADAEEQGLVEDTL